MRQIRWLTLIVVPGLLAVTLGRLERFWRVALPGVSGQVRATSGPLDDCQVRIKGTSVATSTGTDGRFRLTGFFPRITRLTAAKAGYFIAGTALQRPTLDLDLRPLPTEDCERYEWVGPEPDASRPRQCGNCHGEIYREWSSSGHARSVTNRHFRNLYDGTDWHGNTDRGWNLLAEHPDGAGVCTACHAPTVKSEDPAYFDLRQAKGTPAQGIHCDYCHKITNTTGQVGLTHGRFGIKLLRPTEGQIFFGPLDDVDRGEDAYSPLYRDSRYCASCHEGTVFGVHVYGSYSEWLDSPARRQGKQCQTCHMAPTGSMTNIAPGRGGISRNPQTLGNHRFFAGSQADMLRRCLQVATQVERQQAGVLVRVELRVEDVGHRVPTGFVDRHLVLVVEVLDEAGHRLNARTGPLLPSLAGKDLAGQPGRLYGKVLKDFEGHSPAPFWRAVPELSDTRLAPGMQDTIEYVFPSECRQVRVRLLYRRFWAEVAAIKQWPGTELVVFDQTW